MKNNMGTLDRGIRFVIAFIFLMLFAMKLVTGTWAVILLVIAGFFILSSLVGFCPLYLLFKIDTRSYEKKKKERKQ